MKRSCRITDQLKYLIKIIRSFAFVLILLLAGSTLLAQTKLLDRHVEYSEHSTTIKAFLDSLGKKESFTFSYGQYVIASKKVLIAAGKKTIREHLEYVFMGDSLKFKERGSKILIMPDRDNKPGISPYQTVRGRIIDIDSKLPLCGITVLLGSEGPPRGTITDSQGIFKFQKVRVGRHGLNISSIGYDSKVIPDLMVASGKEQVLSIELIESVIDIPEVTISANPKWARPINDLTTVSGRSFSAYEIESYPGSLSDVSRVAQSFPGVLSSHDGRNHLVIRGNSPKGLLWRLEGIEIPNLNHFSNIGASGGGIGIISNNMIGDSDFLTGAFSSEYGNAISGVFDLRLRTGNNERHEQSFQLGLIGTELMAEGPLSKTGNATYIAHYRYSTFKIIQKLGANLMSIPDFQDLSFKLYLPTGRAGVFSVFGIGGLSHEEGESGYIMNSNMGTLGFSNNYTFNESTFFRSVLSFSAWNYNWFEENNIGTDISPIDQSLDYDVRDYSVRLSVNLNKKFTAKHKIKTGLILDHSFNNSFMGWFSDTLFNIYSDPSDPGYLVQNYDHQYVNDRNDASTLQAYLNWKYRVTEELSFNTGVHFMQYYLNNNYSLEPRLGFQWEISPKHVISGGFGIHSRKESMTLYAGKMTLIDGTEIQPNLDLELSKSRHYVLGYEYLITPKLNIKAEAYYQHLYDIPAHPFPPYFSTINFDFGFEGNILDNYGTAYNKGLELTIQKHLDKGFHFIFTGTVYESKYRNKLGQWLHTKYDGTYASNGTVGKEFKIGKNKQNIFSISGRYILIGGMRQLPIDRELSLANGYEVTIWDNGYSQKASDYFRIDLQLKFIINKSGHSSEWSLDIMNLTNRKNELSRYWDRNASDFRLEYQNPLIPMINYRIQF